MRADRLLWLLLSLQAEGRLTADVLAARFEVSQRTIYRDVDALATAGVPIYTQAGPNGGIFLDEKYRTSLTGLSLTELRALFVAAGTGPLADLGLADAVTGISLKLFAALPHAQQHEVQRLRQRLYIDSANWFDYRETPSLLPDLQQAVWEDREIVLGYRNYMGSVSEPLLQAYALVAKANVWYLVARADDGSFRTYRTERISMLKVTDTHFARDPHFDLVRYWDDMRHTFEHTSATTYPFYPVLLRVTSDAFAQLRAYVPARYTLTTAEDEAGWSTVRVLFLSLHEAQMQVLGLGAQVRIVEPDELRETVLATARASQAVHASDRSEQPSSVKQP
jgi:predicted DNA-binding transcriptional regulator YafY